MSSIRNLGPRSVEMFAKAGIHTAEDVRELGADAAYGRLVQAGIRPHFLGYYALVMALQNRAWNDLGERENDKLRERFNKVVAEARGGLHPEIVRALDALGVRVTGD